MQVQGNTFILQREKYQGLPVICLVHYSRVFGLRLNKSIIIVYLYSANTESSELIQIKTDVSN